ATLAFATTVVNYSRRSPVFYSQIRFPTEYSDGFATFTPSVATTPCPHTAATAPSLPVVPTPFSSPPSTTHLHCVVDEGAHLGDVVAAICRGSRFVIGLECRSRELQRAGGRISCCGVGVTVIDRRVVEVGLAVTHYHHPGFPVRAGYWIGDAFDRQ